MGPQDRKLLNWRAGAVAAAIFAAGLAATWAAGSLARHIIHSNTQGRFSADTAEMASAVGERVRAHAEVLVSMQGLYASVGRIDRAQFQRYVDVLDLVRRYPGFEALQVLRHVTPEGLDAFIAETRTDTSVDPRGQPSYTVHPAGPRPVYNVIQFVEPMRGNERVLGFDVGSNPAQLDSLVRGGDTGRIVATPPVKLLQDESGGLGFILRAPLYKAGELTATVDQRRNALLGFAAAVYRANDLMRGVLDARTLQQMNVRVLDRGYARVTSEGAVTAEPADPSATAVLLFDSREPNLQVVTPVAEVPIGIAAERSLVVGDRLWLLHFAARAGSSYAADPTIPTVVLASGSVISLLLAGMALSLMRAGRLSRSLGALDAEQRALVENPLAGILFTRGRTVVRGNHRMGDLCGRPPEALAGLDLADLAARPEDAAAFEAALAAIAAGGTAALELHLKCPDRPPVVVDAFGRPLFLQGRRGDGEVLWVMQDKTDALAVEAERRGHEQALHEANAHLIRLVDAAEARTMEITLLAELSSILQSCQSMDEVFASVQAYAARLFPDEAGAVYVLNRKRAQVVRGGRWGVPRADLASFAPDACWALRRGQAFPVSEASRGLVCDHVAGAVGEGGVPNHVCQPLIARNRLLGLLYREPAAEGASASALQLATMLAEQVSLALANIDLREQLRGQALRDPLTGLGNRRFVEDALALQIAGIAGDGRPLSVALIDLDHFKQINDTHSHEAGDAVLRAIGDVLRANTRQSDIIARYGGEEFLLLLPNTGPDGALAVANHLLQAVRSLRVLWSGGVLDGITASIGIAAFPDHVSRPDDLIVAADAALYRAKAVGRDQVVVSAAAPDLAGQQPDMSTLHAVE
ncbi:UNVERIFIED_ORG: diguanylate cyclase (GGDEF)-like protein [Xanthobacter viscosus]|uniref:diguanylate cyclase n=1 Tax=Xanthobacter autotrophicus TaxID=280 RepID=A0A6C1KD90_XANAU|nr:diguanylate cyclase [Xanthobacter autotrophicus]TLX42248.1 diguanylate cyclase [Xanthobacter autotrophicus]